jgi:predicted DNA repair protein MutK
MPAISTILAGIGVAASLGGTYLAYKGSEEAAKATDLQKKSEDTRQQQMNLDAMRRKRDIIRQAQIAQSTAQATATSQGAGESSGIAGAMGGISGMAGVNSLGVSQNQELGNKMFDINREKLDVFNQSAMLNSAGSGMQSLGGALVRNSGTLGKVGTYLGSQFS